MKKLISIILLTGVLLIPSITSADDKEIINTYINYITAKELKPQIVLNSTNDDKGDLINKFVVNKLDYYFNDKSLIKEINQKTYITPDKKHLELVVKDIDQRIKRLFPNQEYKTLPSQKVAHIFFSDLLNHERIKYHETEHQNNN